MEKRFTVYVLHSEEHNKIYIGHTGDLESRVKSHNELGSKGWTRSFRPWKVVHTEQFSSRQEAIQRGKSLKSAAGRRWIRDETV